MFSLDRRVFVMHQGPASPFFGRLADALMMSGSRVLKFNYNVGDLLYWGRRKRAQSLRCGLDELEARFVQLFSNNQVTDQILFGDCRPVHKLAITVGNRFGIRSHVFEEGYFRPYWVTLERDGTNGFSRLSKDPTWFQAVASGLPELQKPVFFKTSFAPRALHDVAYHVAGLFNPVLFSGYQTHSPINAPREYAGYLKRFSKLRLIRQGESKRLQAMLMSKQPYFVLPLQLNTDAQIHVHSPFTSMEEVIDVVLRSFAEYAPGGSALAIKNHPLDMGLSDFSAEIRKGVQRYGLAGRVQYFEDGDLLALFENARGVVTVNSTTGMLALELGLATITLADPIYNLQGLTFQGHLNEFWAQGEAPDKKLFNSFRDVVLFGTQVNGGLYCREGIKLAVENSIRILTSRHSPLDLVC